MTNQEIKGNLARLLATENLVVEHRSVPTASFDVDRRVLTLPNWDRASSVVYDMLVGHEVGHALFTPNEDWREAADCPQDYMNVIEDARIEKLMKRKYPGLRKSFAGGYAELNAQDFFGLGDDDLTKYSLIDRINLHFKVGANALIPFIEDEKVFVTRTEEAETFAEVLQIAIDVYEFSKKEKTQELQPIDVQLPNNQTTQGGGSSTQDGGDYEEEQVDEDQPEEDSNGEGQQHGSSQQPKASDIDGEDGGQTDEAGETSKTQDSFDRAAEKLTGHRSSFMQYIEILDTVDIKDYVADWTEIHDWIDDQRNLWIKEGTDLRMEQYTPVDTAYREFRKQSQKEVNYLVKEFECRKSADAYARSGQSKTGVLDTSKLHTYKFNEDIFKKVTVLPDGKNHGLLFLLDWSGSMSRELFATVKQLLNLTAFCKKVQIPFEVYAFTNDYSCVRRIQEGKSQYFSNEEYFASQNCIDGKIFIQKGMFHLMNFVSSRSNSKDYERMCLNLFREAYTYHYGSGYPTTTGLGLSGTPLNEGVIMLNYIIPQFRKQNDLQKVNVCILTDGEACPTAYGRKVYDDYRDTNYIRPRRLEENCCLRDRKTGRVYKNFSGWENNTNIFIQQLRDRNPNVNVLGFRILAGSRLSDFICSYGDFSQYAEVQKQWKKEKFAIVPFPKAFTAIYAISNSSLDDEVEFSVESGAKKGEITKAFKKMLNSKSTNKKLLNSFVEYVA
jgi:hypothetical protein